ncbi:MAG: hypothetical protein A2566_02955 [Candidatus Zambryskibacteria bacterium RIFOXYD1_FULL_40_13]|nr:MAG: hypothetical protein UT25_C0002G0093 [Parcubacteria group bacterium GW2011_GWC1_39_12]KKR19408.1 MAG: hypothetical protein UT49_C0002G0254 [Parcubacteria group bacterium GW2011_GWF1_39_37]KKR35210.1 MAG: hypothetical protein UT68_C0004G0018 [Parcubacteria group bacterium GW2011_GWC2_40_10]KKR52357.1 MAG: hypothetical protein UT89_C0002G0158 [Parcubacteria group bacterium GW2011_GWE1_40_20]KKR69421.1 MAG: hypothetical protein UU11_C0001G0007 [Parcubacteria group bacterium GW2011_GWF2_40_
MNKDFYKKGFTISELLISIFILSVLTLGVSTFQRDVFSLNFALQNGLSAQMSARRVVKTMVAELRETGPSALGAYPIASASSTSITFYSDVNNDGLRDRVRYYVSGTNVKRGIIAPSGNPLTYNSANEKISNVISDFIASSTRPLFEYYPADYAGSTAPLTYPVNIQSVRLVKVTAIIDKNPGRSPAQIVVTSQVNLRNLKDNL